MSQIGSFAPADVKVAIVGNKTDLTGERRVSFEEGEAIAAKYGVPFFELSAKTGDGINEAFLNMGEQVLHKIRQTVVTSPNDAVVMKRDLSRAPRAKPKCCKA